MGVSFLKHPHLTGNKSDFTILAMTGHSEPEPRKRGNPEEASDNDAKEARSEFGTLGKSVFDLLPVGVVVFGPDLKIIEANLRAATVLGPGDYVNESLARGGDEKTRDGLTGQLKAVFSGQTHTFEGVRHTSGDKTRTLHIICTPLRKPGSQGITGGAVIFTDTTDQAETQRRLAEAERLAAVGKLAAKVAHELNNPMDGILRYINLAMRIVDQERLTKPKEYLTQCRQGLMRMVQIVSELLEFSRSTYASFEYASIEQIVEDAVKAMEARAEASDIRILRDYTPGIPEVRSRNLFQVFCNLAKNALDAMPEGGELRISTRLAREDVVAVEFMDTGTGFAPENREVIFEPFFTTKERGSGTGLGLAICRDIVAGYNGRITAENSDEGGSVFTVFLPVGRQGLR
jgi:signal transduction histidine kinase